MLSKRFNLLRHLLSISSKIFLKHSLNRVLKAIYSVFCQSWCYSKTISAPSILACALKDYATSIEIYLSHLNHWQYSRWQISFIKNFQLYLKPADVARLFHTKLSPRTLCVAQPVAYQLLFWCVFFVTWDRRSSNAEFKRKMKVNSNFMKWS